MKVFNLQEAKEILSRTPSALTMLLRNLPSDWAYTNEGGDSWSAFDVLGHFIHGEKTDWIPRAKIILSNTSKKEFVPFDRFAQFELSKGKTIEDLLAEFSDLREKNLTDLTKLNLNAEQLDREGIHPEFGTVTLSQLLASWVVHDMAHIAQVGRVIAKQYKDAVGPWVNYMAILQ